MIPQLLMPLYCFPHLLVSYFALLLPLPFLATFWQDVGAGDFWVVSDWVVPHERAGLAQELLAANSYGMFSS